jgi:hypothetical protein
VAAASPAPRPPFPPPLKGIRALADEKELLGSELRDVFDAHPPRPLSGEERAELLARGPTGGMARFTDGKRGAPWPYGVEWLGDAYPVPYFARQQAAGAPAGGGGAGAAAQ